MLIFKHSQIFTIYVDAIYMTKSQFTISHILQDGTAHQLFISKSYDATSHFETTCLDVLDIFKRGTGEEFDFSKVKHTLEDQD